MVFHEITPGAIAAAVANPRELNSALVDAQETRRILDRLYGYEVSPVLWKKVLPRLSAGRVQSVCTRLLVERERERMAFRPAGYWDLEVELAVRERVEQGDPDTVTATLVAVGGTRVATGRDFDRVGALQSGQRGRARRGRGAGPGAGRRPGGRSGDGPEPRDASVPTVARRPRS